MIRPIESFHSEPAALKRRAKYQMKRSIVCAVMILGICAGGHAEPSAPIRGTHVILVAPPGFDAADRFPGYMSEETGASIMASELPAPLAEVTKGFSAEGFKKQGMTLLTKADESFGAHKGFLVSVSQSAGGIDFLKWMAVFGDEKTTYIVTSSFPKVTEAELSDVLKKAVLGARVSTEVIDPLKAVTFRVSPANDMKIAKVFGNNIVLSKNGIFPTKGIETPIMVAGASASKGLEIPDRKAFSERRLKKIDTLKDIRSKSTEPIMIDGLDGFESLADATDTDTGVAATVYQVILFDTDGYYVIQGIASEKEGKTQLSSFREIAKTFKKSKAQQSVAPKGR